MAGHVVYFLSLACFFYQVRSNGHLHACIKARLSLAVARACLFVRTVPFFFFFYHAGILAGCCAMMGVLSDAANAMNKLSER